MDGIKLREFLHAIKKPYQEVIMGEADTGGGNTAMKLPYTDESKNETDNHSNEG